MARISFEEFSAGLPVQRAGQPNITRGETAVEQSTGGFLADAEQDRLEMGQSLQQTLDIARTERQATRQRVESGEISPAKGAFQTIGGGLFRGGEFLAKTALGLGKMALPESAEKRIGATLGKDLQAIPSLKESDFYKNLENPQGGALIGKEQNEQIAGRVKEAIDLYESDPNFRADVNAAGGILNTVASLISTPTRVAGETPSLRSLGTLAVEGLDQGVQNVPIRTAQQAAEETLSQFGEKPAPTQSALGATVSGMARQVGDFAGRTAREAQEVAAREQRLASLPQPEAAVRRVVADERVIDLVNNLTPEEIAVTQRLVDQAKLKQGDITPNTQHPKVIAGEELLKPVDYIIETRQSVGSKLGELRSQLSETKNINTNAAFRDFHQYLKNNYGVQFDKTGNIIPGSGTLARSDVSAVQDLYSELRRGTFMSERQIDEFLQRSYKDFDLRQAREQVFSDEVTRIAERARKDMRQLMPEQYNALATRYAELSKPVVDMVKLLGYKGDLDKLTAKDLKAGEVGMRILGNAADRPQSVIDEVVQTAQNYGFQSDVNLNNIITLADQLEGLYDITPARSFAGQVTRGVDQSGTIGTMSDIATFNVGGLYNRAAQSRASQDEIREAFEAYLRSKTAN